MSISFVNCMPTFMSNWSYDTVFGFKVYRTNFLGLNVSSLFEPAHMG